MDYASLVGEENLDYAFLKELCWKLRPKIILEFGVMGAGSTKAFLEVAEKIGARVISIDVDNYERACDSPNWEFHQMNDLDFEIDEPIDILFIDTSHTYEQTLAELKKFAPKVKKTGVILLHDTVHSQPVLEAIVDYLKEFPNKYVFENRPSCNGLGILWPRKSQ